MPETITPDGRELVGDVAKRLPGTPDAGGQGIATFDVRSHALHMLYQFSSTRFQATAMAVDADWLVWVQDPDGQLQNSDWQLVALNRRAGVAHVVAEGGRDPNGQPLQTFEVQPTLAQGNIYWSATIDRQPLGQYISTFAAPESGGVPHVVRANSFGARASGTHIAVLSYQPAPIPTSTAPSGTIILIDLNSGNDTVVPHATGVTALAYGGAGLAWITGSAPGVQVWVANADGASPQLIEAHGTPQFPTAGDHAVAWDSYNAGLLAYQPGSSRILRLGNTVGGANGESVGFTASWMFWTEGTATVKIAALK